MDVDYRVLSNTGIWCIRRLQTDADRGSRDRESLSSGWHWGIHVHRVSHSRKTLKNRGFVMRYVHDNHGTVLVQPRYAMSYMRGPLTPAEIRRLRTGT